MQKAVRISSIVFIFILALAILSLIIGAVVFFVLGALPEEAILKLYPRATDRDIIIFRGYMIGCGIASLIMIPWIAVGLVLDIILLKKSANGPYARPTMIVLGVFAMIFGAEVPGIINIVWGAIQGKSTRSTPTVVE